MACKIFLQSSLGIDLLGILRDALKVIQRLTQDEIPRRVESAIEINRAHHAFKGIRQGRGALASSTGLLAASHHEVSPEIHQDSMGLERRTGNNAGTQLRHLALAEIGYRR